MVFGITQQDMIKMRQLDIGIRRVLEGIEIIRSLEPGEGSGALFTGLVKHGFLPVEAALILEIYPHFCRFIKIMQN